MVAISSNADMVQSFYFAKPDKQLKRDRTFAAKLEDLLQRQHNVRSQYNRKLQSHFDAFKYRYNAEVEALKQQTSFEQCGGSVFEDERAVRCYLLNQQGFQIGKSLYSPQYSAKLDIRFTPLLAGENANWSHRHYHYRSIQNPGVTQVSRPYLSVAGSHMCVTVSQAVQIGGALYVLCCDLDWPDEDETPL